MPAASETDTDLAGLGDPPPVAHAAVVVGDDRLTAQVRGVVTRWRALGGTAVVTAADGWDIAGRPPRWVRCTSVAVRATMTPRPERGLLGWTYIARQREGIKTTSGELWLRFAGWPARRGTIAEVRAYCDARPAERAPAALEGL